MVAKGTICLGGLDRETVRIQDCFFSRRCSFLEYDIPYGIFTYLTLLYYL